MRGGDGGDRAALRGAVGRGERRSKQPMGRGTGKSPNDDGAQTLQPSGFESWTVAEPGVKPCDVQTTRASSRDQPLCAELPTVILLQRVETRGIIQQAKKIQLLMMKFYVDIGGENAKMIRDGDKIR